MLLVKPQFEAGKVEADRGRGVIRDPVVWRSVLEAVEGALPGSRSGHHWVDGVAGAGSEGERRVLRACRRAPSSGARTPGAGDRLRRCGGDPSMSTVTLVVHNQRAERVRARARGRAVAARTRPRGAHAARRRRGRRPPRPRGARRQARPGRRARRQPRRRRHDAAHRQPRGGRRGARPRGERRPPRLPHRGRAERDDARRSSASSPATTASRTA